MANKTFREFLDVFGGSVPKAAESIGVSRQTIYNWQKQHRLTDDAMNKVRIWFLETQREVPADWMPK